jgi:hypothetical protein
MNDDELEKILKEGVMAQLRYDPNTFLEGLRKTMKYLSQDSPCPSRNPNMAPPKYQFRVLPRRPACLAVTLRYMQIYKQVFIQNVRYC